MPLTSDDFNALNALLAHLKDWQSEQSRRDLLEEALTPSPRKRDLLGLLDVSGTPRGTAVRTVSRLNDFGQDIPGRPVLCLLLATLHHYTSGSDHTTLQRLSRALDCSVSASSLKGDSTMLPPEMLATGIPFLFEIGRWAKSELSEIWKLRRQEKEVELSKAATTEAKETAEAMLVEAANSVGEAQLKATLDLIARKRGLINDLKQAMVSHEREYSQQRIMESAFNERVADTKRRIQQHLDDIAEELTAIGIDIERK